MTDKINNRIILWICVLVVSIIGFLYMNQNYHSQWNTANTYFTKEFNTDNTQPTKLANKIDHEKAIIQSHQTTQVSKLQKINQHIRSNRDQIRHDQENKPNPYGSTLISGDHWNSADADIDGTTKLSKVSIRYKIRAIFILLIIISAVVISKNIYQLKKR